MGIVMRETEFRDRWLALVAERAESLRQTRNTQEDAVAQVEQAHHQALRQLQSEYADSIGLPVGAPVGVNWDGYQAHAREKGVAVNVPVMTDIVYRVDYIAPNGCVVLADVDDKYNFIPSQFVVRQSD